MKVRLMIIIGVISFLLGGCNKIQKNSNQVQLVQRTEEILVESEDLADDYFHIYKERWNQSNRNSLKLQQDIIEYLGRKNYIAVDINNQIDMVNGELVKKFCKNVQNEVNDSITIFSIMESGGFVRYDLNSQNGEIYAICSNMTWDQDAPEAEYINEFQVQSWKYTKNGYFFIEEYDRQGYDGYHGKIGFRVEPLDEACRELNRKYVMPGTFSLCSQQGVQTGIKKQHPLVAAGGRSVDREFIQMDKEPAGREQGSPVTVFKCGPEQYIVFRVYIKGTASVLHCSSKNRKFDKGRYLGAWLSSHSYIWHLKSRGEFSKVRATERTRRCRKST